MLLLILPAVGLLGYLDWRLLRGPRDLERTNVSKIAITTISLLAVSILALGIWMTFFFRLKV